MNRLHLWWLRRKYIKVTRNGALAIDARWYIETGAMQKFWLTVNAQRQERLFA